MRRAAILGTLFCACAGPAGPASPDAQPGVDGGALDGGPPPPLLPGPPDDPANLHVPDSPFPAFNAAEFTLDNGIPYSRVSLVLMFQDTTTVAAANQLLAALSARIVGGLADAGLLFIRIPDTGDLAQATRVLEMLMTHPDVLAVAQDTYDEVELLPPLEADHRPPLWDYTAASPPQSGAWGLQAIRAPFLWNLRSLIVRAGRDVKVALIDDGFDTAHPDLTPQLMSSTASVADHGTLVASILGATWDNQRGVEGVAPARLRAILAAPNLSYALNLATLTGLLGDPQVHAVNNSYGRSRYYITNPGTLASARCTHPSGMCINPPVDRYNATATITHRQFADSWGDTYHRALATWGRTRRNDFIIVASAGNAGQAYFTRDNGAITNAAVRYPDGFFAAVEAVDNMNNASSFSDQGGTLSAPGTCVRGAEAPGVPAGMPNFDAVCPGWDDGQGGAAVVASYATNSGTSFAAPYVTGLITTLWSLDPTLGLFEIWSALKTGQARTGGWTQPRVDAFNAVMGLDLVRKTDDLQRALVDVDDGSVDGNLRQDLLAGTAYTDIVTGERGDRAIDMSDFRAFRDARAAALGTGDLNGGPDHPKKDLNGDGCVGARPVAGAMRNCMTAPPEADWSRYDFNGDNRFANVAAPFKGGMKKDVEVLAGVWGTGRGAPDLEGWGAADLEGLLDSGDLELRAFELFTRVAQVTEVELVYNTGLAGPSPDRLTRTVTRDSGGDPPFAQMAPFIVATVPVAAAPIQMTGVIRAGAAAVSDLCPRWSDRAPPWPPLVVAQDRLVKLSPCLFRPDLVPSASGQTLLSFAAHARDRDIVPGIPAPATTGITSIAWSFGDGGAASGEQTTHRYDAPGTFFATVTAVDDDPDVWQGPRTSTAGLTVLAPTVGPAVWLDAVPLSGCLPVNDKGECVGGLPVVLAASAVDPGGLKPEELSYTFSGTPFGAGGPDPRFSASGKGESSVAYTLTRCETIAFAVEVKNGDGLVGTAALVLDVESCGFARFDLPSLRLMPSAVHDYVNASGATIKLTPALQVAGGGSPPAGWRVEWDFDAATGPFTKDAESASGDRSVGHTYAKPGRYTVLARSYSSADVPSLFVVASTTLNIDVGAPTARIVSLFGSVTGAPPDLVYRLDVSGEGVDPDGSAAPSYAWTITNSDGSFKDESVKAAAGFVLVPGPDSYTAVLHVTDDDGLLASAQAVKAIAQVMPP